jgi:2'-5' RNA ligase
MSGDRASRTESLRSGARPLRLFLAVFPPPEVQRAAAELIERLRAPGDGVSWVKPDNLHYTLRFIGDVGEDGARRVGEAADRAVAGCAAFDTALGGLGAFPNARRPRVIWIGVAHGAEPFTALGAELERELRAAGFGRADHAFKPHLTLGRVREPGDDWSDRLEPAAVDPARAAFRVDRLCVVASQLSPRGSIYTVRHEARLADN